MSPLRERWVVVLLAVLILTSVFIVWYGSLVTPTPSPSYPIVNASLQANLSQAPVRIAPNFLGVNLRADYPIAGVQGSLVAAASVHFVRWPGGALADRYDPVSQNGQGIIYSDGGRPSQAATSPAQFVSWCESNGCLAIITVPGEINDPGFAAQEVRYFGGTLHFSPAYWEIGNEPGAWAHFGVPWPLWSPNQTAPPSPAAYAQVVNQYAAAMHSVDASAHIIGLAGTGQPVSAEPSWVSATVGRNGPNLSAVAIHVYPVGSAGTSVSLAAFYQSLQGSGALPARVAGDRAAIHTACLTCPVALFADEVGSATGNTSTAILSSFSLVPYETAEVMQAMQQNVTRIAFWVSQSSYAGSWITPSGATRPVYTLFSTLLSSLPPVLRNMTVLSTTPGLEAVLLIDPVSAHDALVVVDTNPSFGFRVSFPGLFPASSSVEAWSWNNTTSAPVRSSWSSGAPSSWTLNPISLLIWRVNASGPLGLVAGGANWAHPGNPTSGVRTGISPVSWASMSAGLLMATRSPSEGTALPARTPGETGPRRPRVSGRWPGSSRVKPGRSSQNSTSRPLR